MEAVVLGAVVGALFGVLAGAAAGWMVARRQLARHERSGGSVDVRPEPDRGPVQSHLPLGSSELSSAMTASRSVLEELESRYAGAHAETREAATAKGRRRRKPGPG